MQKEVDEKVLKMRAKIAEMRKQMEKEWRDTEISRLGFCVDVLKKYLVELRTFWKEEDEIFKSEVYKDWEELSHNIGDINMEAMKQIGTTEHEKQWEQYKNKENAANESTLSIEASTVTHTLENSLLTDPESNTLSELKLKTDVICKTMSFIEMHDNLFNAYLDAAQLCAKMISKITCFESSASAAPTGLCLYMPPNDSANVPSQQKTLVGKLKLDAGMEDNSVIEVGVGGTKQDKGIPVPNKPTSPATQITPDKGNNTQTNDTGESDYLLSLKKTKRKLMKIMYEMWDRATKYAMQHANELGGVEGELETNIKMDDMSFGLWLNPNRNIRKRVLELDKMGITVHLPKQISVTSVAVRITVVNCNMFESTGLMPIGFMGILSLIAVPPMGRKIGIWIIEDGNQKLVHLPYPMKSANFPPPYPACRWEAEAAAAVNSITSSSGSMAGGMSVSGGVVGSPPITTAQPITVDVTVPDSFILPRDPMVAMWGHSGWTTDDIETSFTPEKRLVSFTTSRIGPFAIVTDKGFTVPYRMWSVVPKFTTPVCPYPSSVCLTDRASLRSLVVEVTIIFKFGLEIVLVVSEKGITLQQGVPSMEGTLYGSVRELGVAFCSLGIPIFPDSGDAQVIGRKDRGEDIEEIQASQIALLCCLPYECSVVSKVSYSKWNSLLPKQALGDLSDPFPKMDDVIERCFKESKGWIDPEVVVKKKKKRAPKPQQQQGNQKDTGPKKKIVEQRPEDALGDGPYGYTQTHVDRISEELENVVKYTESMATHLSPSNKITNGFLFQIEINEKSSVNKTPTDIIPPVLQGFPEKAVFPTKAMAEEKVKAPPPKTRSGKPKPKLPPKFSTVLAERTRPLPSGTSSPEKMNSRFSADVSEFSMQVLLGESLGRFSFRKSPIPNQPLGDDVPCYLTSPFTRVYGTLLELFGVELKPCFMQNMNKALLLHLKELLRYLRLATFS